ncbi:MULTISPECIES: hypothetical protein [Streptomyces]|uniref:hypothetical protein n=1 Tax=Streptomyces TaxID=1883 RepID=UPI00148952E3|nr:MULTISPECIES: hypothetical protein [Streptomyces]
MTLASPRRFVLLLAATVLAAGATSLSAPAFAATPTQDPKDPGTCAWILADDGYNVCTYSGPSGASGGDTDFGEESEGDPSGATGGDTDPGEVPDQDLSVVTGGDTEAPAGGSSVATGGDTEPPGGGSSAATGGDTTPPAPGGPGPNDNIDYGGYTPPADSGPIVK